MNAEAVRRNTESVALHPLRSVARRPTTPAAGAGNGLRRSLALLIAAGVLTAADEGRADWPMARHDSQRRAAASGKSNITKPAVAWSRNLGGSLTPDGLLAADIYGDGHNELIRSSGGTVAAMRVDGSTIWKTLPTDAATLLGIADLDGDGKREVVAYTQFGVRVIDLTTGAVAWAQPPGEMGEVGRVRMADLNGDGLPELLIGEAVGGGGDKPQAGFIYSFHGGFSAPHRVALPYPGPIAAEGTTLANMDGQGGDEILLASTTAGETNSPVLVDGTTGTLIAPPPQLGLMSGIRYVCLPGNLDGVPGDEVVCVASTGPEPQPGSGDTDRVFALHFTPGPPPSLQVLWSKSLSPNEATSIEGHDLIVDLAGDGKLETLVTGRDASGGHTVHVLQASTGLELASVPGATLVGTAPTQPSGRLIVTQGAAGLSLWSFTAGKLQARGSMGGDSVQLSIDPARSVISEAGYYRPIALDATGDGVPDLFTIENKTGQLNVYAPGPTQPSLVGSVPFSADAPLIQTWPFPPMDRPFPQLAIALTDGTLHLLDHNFAFTATSVRFGGFYLPGGYGELGLSPVVASLDGAAAEGVLVGDSRGLLLRLDATAATPDQAPTTVWEQSDITSPVLAPHVDGAAAAIFALHRDATMSPPLSALRRMRADGSVVWDSPFADAPRNDIALAHFDSDAVPDIALLSGVSGAAALVTSAISGADGHTIWKSTEQGGGLPGGVSISDWNGDGIDDVVQQYSPTGNTQIVSGVDGSPLLSGGPSAGYFLPILADVNGDGLDEAVFTASSIPEQVWQHDLSKPIFVSTEMDKPYPYGAIAKCSTGTVLVEGSWAFPSRLKITALAAPSVGEATTVFLVGGHLYADQASADAVGLAQLSAVNVHENLTGTGRPSAVVGSGDGWLYAVDPCTGQLQFAHDFQAPVGEPVFGDTNGDGLDEIIVSVADGYLYALGNEVPPVSGSGGGAICGQACKLYGRGGCYCEAGAGSPRLPGSLIALSSLVAALARSRRRRRRVARPRSTSGAGVPCVRARGTLV